MTSPGHVSEARERQPMVGLDLDADDYDPDELVDMNVSASDFANKSRTRTPWYGWCTAQHAEKMYDIFVFAVYACIVFAAVVSFFVHEALTERKAKQDSLYVLIGFGTTAGVLTLYILFKKMFNCVVDQLPDAEYTIRTRRPRSKKKRTKWKDIEAAEEAKES